MKLTEIPFDKYDTFLFDRDGTLNVHIVGGYVRCWEEFRFIPGALDTLCLLHQSHKHIFIVSNQRGVGKAIYSEKNLIDIHNKMCTEIIAHGGYVHGIYYCTAISNTDVCRKPNTGLFEQLLHEHPDVNPETTLMIGDSTVDMEFARNCNIDGIQVDSVKLKNGVEEYVRNDMRIYRKK